MKSILIALLAASSMVACAQKDPAVDLSPQEAAEKMQEAEVVVLDVRTPAEYNTGHIEGAVHIDHYADDFRQQIDALDREVTYVVYCRSGGRSGQSVEMMQKMDFKKVYNLYGGVMAWKKEDQALTK